MVSMKSIFALILLLTIATLPSVTATDDIEDVYGSPVPRSEYVFNPEEYDRFYLGNVTLWLGNWNTQMGWGFSPEEIDHFATELENEVFTFQANHSWYLVENATEFGYTLPEMLGLSDEQGSAFVPEYKRQRSINYVNFMRASERRMNFEYQFTEEEGGNTSTINPASPSSPSVSSADYVNITSKKHDTPAVQRGQSLLDVLEAAIRYHRIPVGQYRDRVGDFGQSYDCT